MKLKNNSKNIKKNDIFIATHDILEDRNIYIQDAINKKCQLVITDKDINKENNLILKVNNCNDSYYQMLNNYYGNPYKDINIIAVTGTDGKTTTATIIKNILSNYEKCAYLGTNGFIYDKENKTKNIKTKNTTPGIEDILKYGKILKENNCKYLSLEASSEGLLHNRCNKLNIKCAILTNVTEDHLNIHKTKENYLESKLKLFKNVDKNNYSILNIDDPNYKFFKKNITSKIITYGQNKKSDARFYNIKEYIDKTTFTLKIEKKEYNIESPFQGMFNVYNLVGAILAIKTLNIDIESIIKNIKELPPVKGRMNFVDFNQNFKIILDYAHTEKATKSILEYANKIKQGKIITVVGCAGNRFKEKRRKIGKIVSDLSDIAIFTEDDNRFEKVKDIIDEMKQDIKTNNVIEIEKRKKAIRYALKIAHKNDIVLILGKGIDNYMAKKNKHQTYNDYKEIKRYFTKVF